MMNFLFVIAAVRFLLRRPQLPAERLPKHDRKHRQSCRFVATIEALLYDPLFFAASDSQTGLLRIIEKSQNEFLNLLTPFTTFVSKVNE